MMIYNKSQGYLIKSQFSDPIKPKRFCFINNPLNEKKRSQYQERLHPGIGFSKGIRINLQFVFTIHYIKPYF